MSVSQPHVHDLVGIGFGPSNLALAIALREHNDRMDAGRADERVDAVFFEKQPAFGWHRGMLIEGTTMQVSFLKDLVTMRNPVSEFGFLSYLQARGRLADFINHKTMFPSRVEFHDYLEWAANRFAEQVQYDSEVVSVSPVTVAGVVECLDVVVRRGADARAGRPDASRAAGPGEARSGAELVTFRTRNLVIAAGIEPVLPPGVVAGEKVWHSHELLTRLPELGAPGRVLVVGAGQSAAEVTEHLHSSFPSTEVCAVFTRYGYTPADDSSFANRIFDPEAVEHYYAAPEEVKRMLLAYHGTTNYSVVDLELIDELYRRVYQEKVRGAERLRILNVSRVVDLDARPDGVRATVEFLPTGARTVLDTDLVVYATGYRPGDPLALLGEVGERCRTRPEGGLRVERDYRVATNDDVRCGIYLQGATEHTHGITSTLLSNTAVRAGEIVGSIAGRSAAAPPPYALTR